jgi:hypothetical protein
LKTAEDLQIQHEALKQALIGRNVGAKDFTESIDQAQNALDESNELLDKLVGNVKGPKAGSFKARAGEVKGKI